MGQAAVGRIVLRILFSLSQGNWRWKLGTFSLHYFLLIFSTFVFSEIIIKCGKRTLSCWRLSPPGISEDASDFSVMIVYYVHTKLGIGRQRFWWREILCPWGSRGCDRDSAAAGCTVQTTVAISMTLDSERQRAEEAVTAAAMQAAQ